MDIDTHFKWYKDPSSDSLIFSGRLTNSTLLNLRLDPLDKMVVGSPVETAADMLQTLEIIFRRISEQVFN